MGKRADAIAQMPRFINPTGIPDCARTQEDGPTR
jgi:hypothetical protein